MGCGWEAVYEQECWLVRSCWGWDVHIGVCQVFPWDSQRLVCFEDCHVGSVSYILKSCDGKEC